MSISFILKANTTVPLYQERSLVEILEELSKTYKVFFTYDSRRLDKVSVSFGLKKNENFDQAINRLLDHTNYSYQSFDAAYYVIYENTKKGNRYLKKILDRFERIEKKQTQGRPDVITGSVKDTNGNSLIGVNIFIKGTSKGVITGFEGEFSLKTYKNTSIIVFSHVGFKTKEVNVKHIQNSAHIILVKNTNQLDEIVVIGYGTKTKKEIAGSISSLDFKKLKNTPVQSFDKAIQGRSTGVNIINAGSPGGASQVRIRGIGSISSGNQPLYIVDGVQAIEGQYSEVNMQENVLASINPEDIVSIDILKDASSSIYGAQASNGVVIITTKRGKAGKTAFNFNAHWGMSEVINNLDLLTGPEWTELALEGYENRYGVQSPTYQNQLTILGNPENAPSYNWQKLLFKRGFISNYSFSAEGGSENFRYFLSGSYNKSEGHVIGTGFKRRTLRINLNDDISNRLKTRLTTNLSFTKHDATNDDGFNFNNPTIASAFIVPTNAPYTEDGTIREPLFGLYNENPLVNKDSELFDIKSKTFQVFTSFSLEYKILNDLVFRSNWGVSFLTNDYEYFASPKTKVGASTNGEIYTSNNKSLSWQTDQSLNYTKIFDTIHKTEILLGINYRQEALNYHYISRKNLNVSGLTSLDNAAIINRFGGENSEWRLAGVFGRLNYIYDRKYIFSGTIRKDGSSRFGKNSRWGLFPSLSLAWRISSERFMDKLSNILDELKLRGSYGITGNANIDNFQARGVFSINNSYLENRALIPQTIDNPNLSWEQSEVMNIGVDIRGINKRLEVTADYFIRNTKDVLLDRPIPVTSGYSSVLENLGKIKNQGFELALTTVNVRLHNFEWATNFNFTTIKNTIKELTRETDQIIVTNDNGNETGIIHKVGEPLESWQAIRWAGVNPTDGRPMYYDKNGELTFNPTNDDYVIIGGSIPTFYGGFSNEFSYKNVNLSFMFQYSGGNYLRNELAESTKASGGYGDRNQQRSELSRWQNPGDITDVPIAMNGFVYDARPGNAYSSKHIEKGDYIRLKQVNISYKFPKEVVKKLNLRNMELYLSGSNLWTKTPYSGRDPEILGANETGDYPQSKTYILGVNLRF